MKVVKKIIMLVLLKGDSFVIKSCSTCVHRHSDFSAQSPECTLCVECSYYKLDESKIFPISICKECNLCYKRSLFCCWFFGDGQCTKNTHKACVWLPRECKDFECSLSAVCKRSYGIGLSEMHDLYQGVGKP